MDAHTDWQRFAKDRAARLMIWQTNEADAQLVQLYFQTQEEMSSAVIVMRSDFVDGAHYAPALTDELIRFTTAGATRLTRKGCVRIGNRRAMTADIRFCAS